MGSFSVLGRIRVATVAAAIVGVAMVGCSSTPTAIEASFLKRANAACLVAVVSHQKHPFPFPSFDPLHPNAKDLPVVADYFIRYGEGSTVARELAQLGEPARGRAQWDALLALVQRSTTLTTEQISAARAKDVPKFVGLVNDTIRLQPQIEKAGRAAGFPPSSACGKVYG